MITTTRATTLLAALALALGGCAAGGQPTPTIGPTGTAGASPTPTGTTGSPPATPTAGEPTQVTLMTHDSFAMPEGVFATLEEQHGISLRVLRAGDAGQMVNEAILAAGAPLADVMFGVDSTFLSRALDAGIFEPYRSPMLDVVPDELELDTSNAVTPIDYGDVCLNYDRAAFDAELPPPQSLEDLADPRYAGMLVVQNPATSSPGLAFMLATVERFGESDGPGAEYDWHDYWSDLVQNDVLVVSGWEEAYYSHFSAASEAGDRPIVVSYATSPVAEVVFADPPVDEPPTAVVTDGCFRQVEFAGILAGTDRTAAAQTVIDFMLGSTFQSEIPLNMYVFPANAEVALPEVFEEHAARVDSPLVMAVDVIGDQRERWLEEWTDVVLR